MKAALDIPIIWLLAFCCAWTYEADLFREKCGPDYHWRPWARAMIWPITLVRNSYNGGPKIECSAPAEDQVKP